MRLIKSIAVWLTLLAAPLALTACGGDGANNSADAAPVATAKPPAGKQWTDVYTKTGEGWVKQGNPDAPIKLVEYGSRSCPVCGAFALTGVEPMREKYVKTGQVSYEFRDFLIHPQDLGIALLGRCVSTEAFFPVLDAMYARQNEFNAKTENISPEIQAQLAQMNRNEVAFTLTEMLGYPQFMQQNGMPADKVKACLADTNAVAVLSKQLEEGVAKGVDGTPTFFINDRKVENAVGWAQLEPALRAAGAH
ncbi:DsbA family protein [Sphingomonas sp. LB-2]|uniref:DsbA family protein n=1 Tax=Sphingomonas caeni TaxID=2984949 RepID=UPI002230ACED|nr:DsbA family protein [Sphingomonas caeni]MCW3847042.1 DsbA family protein [Sphingomonas caeni]